MEKPTEGGKKTMRLVEKTCGQKRVDFSTQMAQREMRQMADEKSKRNKGALL